jgi:hypothetical protein
MTMTYAEFVAQNTPAPIKVSWEVFLQTLETSFPQFTRRVTESGAYVVSVSDGNQFTVAHKQPVNIKFQITEGRNALEVKGMIVSHDGVGTLCRTVSEAFAPVKCISFPELVVQASCPALNQYGIWHQKLDERVFLSEEKARIEAFYVGYTAQLAAL